MDLKFLTHYSFHFIFPAFIAFYFFKKDWKKVYLIFISMMLIDLDHLLANPIFDPNRCSIGFHPLHSSFAILFYIFLCVPKKSRLVGLGLVIHIISDAVDCSLM